MNKLTKVSFCIVSVIVILVSMCPISAFALPDSSNTYSFPFSKPTVTEYSGYVELIFRHKPTGYIEPRVVSWFFTPISTSSSTDFSDKPYFTIIRNASQFRLGYSSNSGTYGIITFVESNLTNTVYNSLEVYDTESVYFYNVTLGTDFELIGMHYYGDFESLTFTNALDDSEFYFTYSADSVFTHQLAQIINYLSILIDSSDEDWEYDYSQDLTNILLALNNLDASTAAYRQEFIREVGKLLDLTEDVLSKIDVINGWLEEIFLFLETWIIDIDNWLQDLYWIEVDSYIKLEEIKSTLDAILQILQSKGESDFTEPDTSNLNGYYDTEHSLLDDSNVDTSQIFNVDLNENALSSIWDLVDKVLNVNPKIFGAVISILALGLIALILGR